MYEDNIEKFEIGEYKFNRFNYKNCDIILIFVFIFIILFLYNKIF